MAKGVISPLSGYLLIQTPKEEKVGGFTIQQDKGLSNITGEVIAVGKPRIEYTNDGTMIEIPAPCKVGETVITKSLAGIPYKDYRLVNFDDVVAILNEK